MDDNAAVEPPPQQRQEEPEHTHVPAQAAAPVYTVLLTRHYIVPASSPGEALALAETLPPEEGQVTNVQVMPGEHRFS